VNGSIQGFLDDSQGLSGDVSKAICATLSQEMIGIVPQLDDYLCPVCMTIAWKPIRLACGHLFCIRCMIVLQNSRKSKCPMCREEVVMEADSGKCPSILVLHNSSLIANTYFDC
jgi:hypothetical protein